MAAALKTVWAARLTGVQIPRPPRLSCLKTSFTVFSRTDYELELSSRRVAGRTRVGWTYSKMRTRPHQLRRVAISSPLRSGISTPAESENYRLKSHTAGATAVQLTQTSDTWACRLLDQAFVGSL